MATLDDKFEIAIGETRLLILGVQVLMGLGYRSILEPGFAELPRFSQYLKLTDLFLLLACSAMLFSPVPFHRLVYQGNTRKEVLDCVSRMTEAGLMPLALSLGAELYVSGYGILNRGTAIFTGLLASVAALTMWYFWEYMQTARRKVTSRSAAREEARDDMKPTSINDKVKHVLLEERMVLPGVQALLGFQLAVVLMEGFKHLPRPSQYIHLASLWLITASVILLVAPAAYHRIVEHGECTESFEALAGRIMLLAMAPLALGMCGDLYVVAAKATSSPVAAIASGLMLAFFAGLWFGFPLYQRARKNRRQSS